MNTQGPQELPLVLVVEDDGDLRELLESAVADHGFRVASADCGNAALALVAAGGVDCVVSDIRMPNGDGVELLKAVRKGGQWPPVYLITGYADIGEAELLGLGCRKLFRKPFSVAELLADFQICLTSAQRPSKTGP